MSKKNDTSTGKLKISQVRGKIATRICVILTEAVEKAINDFYVDHIPQMVSPREHLVVPMIRFYNQSDVIRFLQPWGLGRSTAGSIYSRTPVENLPHRKLKDFILLFDDTIRIDIEWTSEKYEYKYVPMASSTTDVHVSMICLDRQKFLDSLHIEPDLEIPKYVDIVGNIIHEGDVICVSGHDGTSLYLDKVKKLTPYSITTDNGKVIKYDVNYSNKLVVINDSKSNLSKIC